MPRGAGLVSGPRCGSEGLEGMVGGGGPAVALRVTRILARGCALPADDLTLRAMATAFEPDLPGALLVGPASG